MVTLRQREIKVKHNIVPTSSSQLRTRDFDKITEDVSEEFREVIKQFLRSKGYNNE